MNTYDTQVLVVGAGPAGLTSAIGLARHGVGVLLVERHLGLSIFPRATGISSRSMEIIRSWGIEAQVRAREFDALPIGRVAPALTAPVGSDAPLGFATADQIARVSPSRYAVVAQDAFEPVLLEHLRTFGTEVRFGTELVSFARDAGGVSAILVDRFSGDRTMVRSRYLIGADGAGSRVRTGLGIELLGPEHLEEHLTALFRAPLSGHIQGPRYGLNMIVGPTGVSILLPTSGDDRWVYARQWSPDAERLTDYTPARLTGMIRAATGVADLDVEILTTMAFSFAAQTAERFGEGRVLLVGDAAHRVTPRGGTGMNMAIQDAHNLSWKLTYVLRGLADPALLDSYERERRPVAEVNVARSAVPSGLGEAVDPLRADLGVSYSDGAFASDGTAESDPGAPWRQSARPGSRAPHVWIDQSGRKVSTLDLFDGGFTVLAGPAARSWHAAAERVGHGTGVPVRVHQIGAGAALRDADGEFGRRYGLGPDGAVLVRPDGYVAWRRPTAPPSPASGDAEFAAALATALGRSGSDRLVVAGAS